MTKLLKWLFSIIILAAIVYGSYWYIQYNQNFPSTDDAYIQANTINIAPRITGRVSTINVQNHAFVNAGDTLFTIDPTELQLTIKKAQAELDNTIQSVRAKEMAVASATAIVKERQAQLTETKKNSARTLKLVSQHLYPAAKGDEATEELSVAKASLKAANSQLNQAKEELGKTGNDNASIRAATTALAQARLNLSYTKVTAPESGYIANFNLRKGDSVSAYNPVFALVENNIYWVSANFKETQLARIKPGQQVTIRVDMYPDQLFTGRIKSIGRGSGSSFALIPSEDATGNWVKVTQRFPVRISINSKNQDVPLRLGASCTAQVDTTQQ